MIVRYPAFVVSVFLLSGCAATRTYVDPARNTPEATVADEDVAYEVFLLGNTGSGDADDATPVLMALSRELQRAPEESAVVFLGDQLNEAMPDSGTASRADANRRLEMIAESVVGFKGRVFVVPGDHDWDGPESVRREEDELERLLGRDDVFIPGDARSGPVVLELNDNLVLVGLDTAWWLEDDPRPTGDAGDIEGDEGEFEITNPGDIIFAVEDALDKYADQDVLVVGHHPLRSNGPHGGQFTVGRHLVPLPIIGSAYPLYRQFAGTRQDLAHPRYRAYRTALDRVFRSRSRLIFASSHERSLQAFPFDAALRGLVQHYLISGSGAGGEPVAAGRGAGLAASDRGYMRLRYMKDGAVWLDAFSVAPSGGKSTNIYHTRLYPAAPDRVDPGITEVDPETLHVPEDSTVVRAVEPEYKMGRLRTAMFGSGYRRAWITPIEFPVLDMSRYDGLTATQKGGGLQTQSLRLQAGNGHEYVLRLLRKNPGRILPPELSESVGADILDDLATATIPWAALAVARLADAAGIYHTNPELVLIPDDPRLGVFREEFSNRLALFEERPTDDMSEFDGLGNSEDIISSAKMLDKVEDDNDHRVDQRFFVRSRLFDMLISDWDRHFDQWRWATFEPHELDPSLEGDARTSGKIYRSIPRDRDFAFYRLGGVLPWAARQVEPKLQPFRRSYGSLKGLTTSAIPLDRRFTTEMTREDWIEIATDLRDSLSDLEIAEAFGVWPREIYAEYGPENIEILRARRDQLPQIAEQVYRLNAGAVDVAGSDKHERFEIEGATDGTVEVVILKTNREGEILAELYRRRFFPDQTKEVRLYGLGGRDQFIINGEDNSAIKVRMIGGAGEDLVVNNAGTNATYYDTASGNDVSRAGGTQLILSDDAENNRYDPEDHRHGRSRPGILPGYRSADGFVLGVNLVIDRPGFRRHPWATSHNFSAAFATGTGGILARYSLRMYDALGEDWDAVFGAHGFTVGFLNRFYGFGNETMRVGTSRSFYYVGLGQIESSVSVIRRVEESIAFQFGGGAAYRNVEADSTRFVGTPAAGLEPEEFEGAFFANGFTSLELNAVDNAVNPRQGFKWTNRASLSGALNGPATTFAAVGSELSVYASPSLEPQITLAGRAGFGHNFGTFPFYSAQTLGGNTNFRGIRRQRYSGHTVAYQNFEVRARVLPLISRTFPVQIGVLGFVDNGRVWADGEQSTLWHQGYGGGLWFNALDLAVMSATLEQGDDGLLFSFGLGFFY